MEYVFVWIQSQYNPVQKCHIVCSQTKRIKSILWRKKKKIYKSIICPKESGFYALLSFEKFSGLYTFFYSNSIYFVLVEWLDSYARQQVHLMFVFEYNISFALIQCIGFFFSFPFFLLLTKTKECSRKNEMNRL